MTSCSDVSTVYLGHDNTVSVTPYSDLINEVHYDMTAVTAVDGSLDLLSSTTTGDDIAASSTDVPVVIWWEQIGTTSEWRIHLKVGLFTGVTAGSYKLRIVITEPSYPNGLVVADDVLVDVMDIP